MVRPGSAAILRSRPEAEERSGAGAGGSLGQVRAAAARRSPGRAGTARSQRVKTGTPRERCILTAQRK
ncbi:hypothetical protein Y1Q_0000447 [Alligator mississippiensis]|uniref:Uncharacterized protein n=1 Tax=Alligator mississippiensis TaxID=8496 RepID=A0A151MB20_ALLMI|nr:hypothetical protein Y1Q_0000447 [Alligator mississippiensis]